MNNILRTKFLFYQLIILRQFSGALGMLTQSRQISFTKGEKMNLKLVIISINNLLIISFYGFSDSQNEESF